MNRSIRLFLQWSLVAFLITFITAGPTSAGWLRDRLRSRCCKPLLKRCHIASAPSVSCGPSSTGCCPAPAYSAPACSAPEIRYSYDAPVDDTSVIDVAPVQEASHCGCASAAHLSSPIASDVYESATMEEPAFMDSSMMEYTSPHDHGMPVDSAIEAPMVPSYDSGTVIEPAPADSVPMDEQPFESDVVETAPVEAAPIESASDAPATTEPEEKPAPPSEPPVTQTPSATPFGAPAENDAPVEPSTDALFGGNEPMEDTPMIEAPTEPSTDDLFGAPVDEPTDNNEANVDDLFGGSSDEPAAPSEVPATDAAPADEAMDDLFGTPDDSAPVPETTPAEGAIDDLFGTPDDAAPAEEKPSESSAIDDLFGSTDGAASDEREVTLSQDPAIELESASPEEPPRVDAKGIDDLFDAPSSDLPEATLDDLFGSNPTQASPHRQSPNSKSHDPEAEKSRSVSVVSSILSMETTFDQTQQRTWIDNTGRFHTEGRLIEINETHIRLLKTNGKTCTVPHSRLCAADAAYVDALRTKIKSARVAMLTSK